jgi:predicted transcriptional regulator
MAWTFATGTCYVSLAGAKKDAMDATTITGDELLRVLATLANPHRLRVVSALAHERNYVSRLARDLGISRALLQVHLRKLEAAGLVSATVEVSDDGKAMKFYEVTPFSLHLTPAAIMTATRTLGAASDVEADMR